MTHEEREPEVDLVLFSMQRFQPGSPERQRMTAIWHACAFSGALREGFPTGTGDLEVAWNELVAECKRRVQ
jgi:hypothetical protein